MDSDDSGDDHFLSDPDVYQTVQEMLEEFSRETDRGVVLIAAEILSQALARTISHQRPTAFPNKRLKRLLSYPGSIATFSARSDIAFLAGFIGEHVHSSIDLIRGLRNDAAHSKSAFSLSNHAETLIAICDLGPGTSEFVHNTSQELIIKNFVKKLMDRGIDLESEIGSNPFSTPEAVIGHLQDRPDAMKSLEEQVPRMKLGIGVWLILGVLKHKEKELGSEPNRT